MRRVIWPHSPPGLLPLLQFKEVGGLFDKAKFKKRPRYSVVLHDVREKLGLSLNTYVVIDSIHKLSTSDHKFPFCIMSMKTSRTF